MTPRDAMRVFGARAKAAAADRHAAARRSIKRAALHNKTLWAGAR